MIDSQKSAMFTSLVEPTTRRINVVFQRAKHSPIFQDVVEQIEEAILDGRLRVGHRLPSERELKDMFCTSRGTLREALRVLEEKGLVSIKPGVSGGAIVFDLSASKVSDSLDLLIRHQKVSLKHLAEFREAVDGIVAGLAAERACNKDIQHLEILLKQAEELFKKGLSNWDLFLRADSEIHMALAKIARNPICESVLASIYENIYRYFNKYLPRNNKTQQQVYEDLAEIVAAVRNRQAARAHLLAQVHIHRFSWLMEDPQTELESRIKLSKNKMMD